MSNCSASGKYDKAKNRPKALQFTEEEEELERTSKQRHRKVQAKQTSADTMSKKQKQQPQAPAALPKLPKLVAKHGIELRGLYPEDAPTIYALHNALSASECASLLAYLQVSASGRHMGSGGEGGGKRRRRRWKGLQVGFGEVCCLSP